MTETTSKHWARKSYQQTSPSGCVNNQRLQKPQAENQEKMRLMSSVLAARAAGAGNQKRGSRPLLLLSYHLEN